MTKTASSFWIIKFFRLIMMWIMFCRADKVIEKINIRSKKEGYGNLLDESKFIIGHRIGLYKIFGFSEDFKSFEILPSDFVFEKDIPRIFIKRTTLYNMLNGNL